jgi:tRNA(fMet)-specific endonuclease VapC
MTFLLDSNILIAFLGRASQSLHDRMLRDEPRLVTSSICSGEVLLGFARAGQDNLRARQLFHRVTVLPYDQEAADRYARLRFRRGRFDRLIAAHALSVGATLVTANLADFADVAGLVVENWLA